MNKTMDFALSLADEFRRAQYLDDVPEKTLKTLAALMDNAMEEEQSDRLLKTLANIDQNIDLKGAGIMDIMDINDHPDLTTAEKTRLMVWSLILAAAALERLLPGPSADAAGEKTSTRDEWTEELRKDVEKDDPAFARYIFGPS